MADPINLLIYLVVILVVASVAVWALRMLSPDATITKFGTVIIVVFAVIALLYAVMGRTSAL